MYKNKANVNVLVEAIHEGSSVEITSNDLETMIKEAVRAGMPGGSKVTVNITIRAVHGGAKVIVS
jgi:hypothetical protein